MVVWDKQMQNDDRNCKPNQDGVDMSGNSFQADHFCF